MKTKTASANAGSPHLGYRGNGSALIELLDSRWRSEISGLPDPMPERPFKRPTHDPITLRAVAREAAEAEHSDPFAGRRALHYMRQGYWLPSDVHADALRQTSARRAAGATFPTVQL